MEMMMMMMMMMRGRMMMRGTMMMMMMMMIIIGIGIRSFSVLGEKLIRQYSTHGAHERSFTLSDIK